MGTRIDASSLQCIIWGTQTSLSQSGTDSVMWFLPVLFCSKACYQLIVDFMFGCVKRVSRVFMLLLAVCLAFTAVYLGKAFDNQIMWGLDIGLMGTALIIAGHLLRDLAESIRKMNVSKQILVFVMCLTGSIFFSYANMPFYVDERGEVIYRAAVWMAHSQYGDSCLLYLASSLFSCVWVLVISSWLERFSLLAILGQHTFALMAVHGKVYEFVASMSAF